MCSIFVRSFVRWCACVCGGAVILVLKTCVCPSAHHNYCGGGVLEVVVDEEVEDPVVVLERLSSSSSS